MSEFCILNRRIILRAAPVALAALAPLSCATTTPATSSQSWNPPAVVLKRAPSLHDVLIGLDEHRAIFVGETHTRYDHHLVQLEVLQFLHQRHQDVAVGVEWFQFPFQQHLDDYLAGRSTEAEMLDRTGYFERWRYDYRLYRPIIEYAKTNNLPVVALNAPREVTQQISAVGITALSEDLKAQLPANYDRSDQEYAERIKRHFEQHPNDNQTFENFLDVMLTWDETMADRAAGHLKRNPQRKMVIFAGAGHVAFGSGIPNRLARRTGEPGATLLVGLEGVSDQKAADYVVLSQPQELPPAGLLGAFLEQGDRGVTIASLSENSALREAGIGEDDVILEIDGAQVTTFAAVKLALLDRKPGDTVAIRFLHNNWLGETREKQTEVTLRGRTVPEYP